MTAIVPNQTVTLEKKLDAVLQLSRWREHVPFTIPLTIVGSMMAVQNAGAEVDWRIIAVTLANILTVAFAFIINDIEDAPDDALNERKRARNVISNGTLTQKQGMLLCWATVAGALSLYILCGLWVMIWGGITLILSYLYSAHPFRLKARPVTDLVSHALMLSALLVMTGYFTYDAAPGYGWYVIVAAFLFSAYGQFYNQVDDYEVDKQAGLRNTVVLLGKTPTTMLMYASLFGAMICMGLAMWNGIFPLWLGSVALVSVFVTSLFNWEHDMRGNPADASGALQRPTLIVANMVTLLWLAQSMGLFFGL